MKINWKFLRESKNETKEENGNPTKKAMEEAKNQIRAKQKEAQEELAKNWKNWNLEKSVEALKKRYRWRVAQRYLEKNLETEIDLKTKKFVVDSMVLEDSYKKLFQDPSSESMMYMTGVVVNKNKRTLNRSVIFKQKSQSATGVEGDFKSSTNALINLEEKGHQMTGWIHNHPGNGKSGVQPSSTDMNHQGRLENLGYDTIGVILSQDGYIRFFAKDLDYKVGVYGDGIEKLDGKHYRFKETPEI